MLLMHRCTIVTPERSRKAELGRVVEHSEMDKRRTKQTNNQSFNPNSHSAMRGLRTKINEKISMREPTTTLTDTPVENAYRWPDMIK